jgi:hypothetical protein
MDTIWQTFLFRLAEHAHVLIPVLIATGVLGLGPSGRAIARRLGGMDAERQELERLREQLAELQERTDYNERQLGSLRREGLPEPRPQTRPQDNRPVTPV